MAKEVDRITTEVIGHRFNAAADEMMATLMKTAYSPNIKERRDCSVGVFDPEGNLIALSAIAAIHLSSLLGLVGNIRARFKPESLAPGDVLLTNDPYVGGGSHLPDLTVASPVFVEGRLVAYVANIAHHSDIGGMVAGSESADCTSIFQEGLRIPLVKLVERGELSRTVLDFVLLNSRTPREREGDLRTQIAANTTGTRRVEDIFARFGAAAVPPALAALLDHAETRTRAEIARLPDGVYEAEDYLDNDGVGDTRVLIKAKITIAGDRIRFDFEGTAPQVRGSRNMPLAATQSTVFYAVKAITDPGLPPNSGYFRAIELAVPPGSVLNCRPPAALGDRVATANILGDVLLAALSKAAPERVMAGCGPLHGFIFSGIDARRNEFFVDYETYAGASGALADQDGRDAVRVHVSGAANLPIESVEQEFALTVDRYELIADSGGPGRFRGGLATRRDVTMWGRDAKLAGRGVRQVEGARPLFGGGMGRTGKFVLAPDTQSASALSSAFSELPVEAGTQVRVETPSGAGYGDPYERDPARVAADVSEGKVSLGAAREKYGVVIRDGAVDDAATAKLRAARPATERAHG